MVAYSRAIADQICAGLAEGRTLRAVCRRDGMPSHVAVLNWRKADTDGFRARYDEAREVGYQQWADEVIDLADGSMPDAGSVQKSRLQFDARRWLLSKALPKLYGDKLSLAGDAENPLEVRTTVNPEDRNRINALLAKARGEGKD